MTGQFHKTDKCNRSGFAGASLLLLLCIAYVVQLASPLRINPDVAAILDLTARLTDGRPFLTNGARPIYPIGVPFLYSVLESMNAARPWGFGVLNLLSVVAAMWATKSLSSTFATSMPGLLLVLLLSFSHFLMFKHFMLPVTDVLYLGASIVSLAFMENCCRNQYPKSTLIINLLAGLTFGIVGILFRRVGVALLPAFVCTVWNLANAQIQRRTTERRRNLWYAALPIATVLLAIVVWTCRKSILNIPDFLYSGPQIKFRLNELGEVLLNLSTSKMGRLGGFIVYPAGIVLFAAALSGIEWAKIVRSPVLVYIVAYAIVLLIWPYGDGRFWLPVLPILALLIVRPASRFWNQRIFRILISIYLAYYFAMSLIAIGYTTRITFSKGAFPDLYAGGRSRADYIQAWSNAANLSTLEAQMIRRFGPEHFEITEHPTTQQSNVDGRN